MFNNSGKKVDSDTVTTILGEGLIIEGKVISKASIRVDGEVNGEIRTEGHVTIGVPGIVTADIRAKEIVVYGTVDGSVYAEKLTIREQGRVKGEIRTKSFIIDEGGTFLGRSNMEIQQVRDEELEAVPKSSKVENEVENNEESSKNKKMEKEKEKEPVGV